MLSLLLAAALASAPPPSQSPSQPNSRSLIEAAHAIDAGRLTQARKMIANAVAAGATGAPVERLLADLDFKLGRNTEALARYELLLAQNPDDLLLMERTGIAALKNGDTARAAALLKRSTQSPATSWRGWNALGVAADRGHDWAVADAAYAQAATRAPNEAQIYNNMGWSKLLRGDWQDGLTLLSRAAELDPSSARIADNLELARAAVAEDLPSRRPHEPDSEWAARLNDAGVIARIRGNNAKAVAAFTRAIEASGVWFERAANNLKLAQSAQ